MRILTICETYPTPNDYSAGVFFHVRNMYYSEHGHEVDVISFSAQKEYLINNIHVFPARTFLDRNQIKDYSIIVCHAPHYKTAISFLKHNCPLADNIVFFFHGNEVFNTLKVNPEVFEYDNKFLFIKKMERKIRDAVKLFLMRRSLESFNANYVFVSRWMKRTALEHMHLSEQRIHNNCHVINNSVGKPFETERYNAREKKEIDFISIRARLDGVKYSIDIVEQLALNHPQFKFLIIGQGKYFDNKTIPPNLTILSKSLNHMEIVKYLNKSRCSLLPTRWDSQGLMTCETATFGIPTITSDIEICHEMLDSFSNVAYIDNKKINSVNLEAIIKKLENNTCAEKNERFFADNTVGKELELFEQIIGLNDNEIK